MDETKINNVYSLITNLNQEPLKGLKSPRIISAGRLVEFKNIDILIKALSLIDNPPKTYILGTRPEEENLKNLVKELKLEEKIEFCGWQSNSESFIAQSNILINPSTRESQGLTAVTTMAYKVPFIGACNDGLSETLGYGSRGLLVPIRDTESLANIC